MFNQRVRRYIVIIAMVVAGGVIIAIIGDSYGRGSDTLLSELLGILLLLVLAMGAGFLAALGLRALRDGRNKSNSKDDE